MRYTTRAGLALLIALSASSLEGQGVTCDQAIETCNRTFPGYLLTPARGWCYLLMGQSCVSS